jgi:catechol 2,3-dioxygenase-like lactoylglutathione lyase family enzyme
MLENANPIATVAVKDLATARRFYGGTLGLEPVHQEGEEAVNYRAGRAQILVYRSQFAGNNKATAVTWMVGDIEATVGELKAKGITFEKYDILGDKVDGEIYTFGRIRNAWFKDPDGNIHSVVSA